MDTLLDLELHMSGEACLLLFAVSTFSDFGLVVTIIGTEQSQHL